MKYLKLLEEFKQNDFLEFKKKKESKLIQKFGDKNIVKFCEENDLNGLDFLFNNGYDISKIEIGTQNILYIAIKNNNIKLLDYLLEKIGNSWGYKNPINSILPSDIYNKAKNKKLSNSEFNQLKLITNYGYNFGLENKPDHSNHNLLYLYLADRYITGDVFKNCEKFIDWLLKKYPENYILCREYLTDNLRIKYSHLEDTIIYNL